MSAARTWEGYDLMPKLRPTKPSTKDWRDVFDIHKAAELFPPMTPTEFAGLKAGIDKHDLKEKIALQRNKKSPLKLSLVEGRHRLQALEELEKSGRLKHGPIIMPNGEPNPEYFQYRPEDENPFTYAISKNANRRHMTSEQKRIVIKYWLKNDNSASNREVARQLGFDHKTVAKEREGMEGRGEIPHVEARIDSKGRQQPARKARAAKAGSTQELTLEKMQADPVTYWRELIRDEGCFNRLHDSFHALRVLFFGGGAPEVVAACAEVRAALNVIENHAMVAAAKESAEVDAMNAKANEAGADAGNSHWDGPEFMDRNKPKTDAAEEVPQRQ